MGRLEAKTAASPVQPITATSSSNLLPSSVSSSPNENLVMRQNEKPEIVVDANLFHDLISSKAAYDRAIQQANETCSVAIRLSGKQPPSQELEPLFTLMKIVDRNSLTPPQTKEFLKIFCDAEYHEVIDKAALIDFVSDKTHLTCRALSFIWNAADLATAPLAGPDAPAPSNAMVPIQYARVLVAFAMVTNNGIVDYAQLASKFASYIVGADATSEKMRRLVRIRSGDDGIRRHDDIRCSHFVRCYALGSDRRRRPRC